MPEPAAPLPPCRPELLIRPLGDGGQYVVKDPTTGAYYHLGPEEYFLLSHLDGVRGPEAVCAAFTRRFGEPLSAEELDEFLGLARQQGFLTDEGTRGEAAGIQGAEGVPSPPRCPPRAPHAAQSPLHWRMCLFDPDRPLTWLAPKIGFFWTGGFLAISASCIVLAAILLCSNRGDLAVSFAQGLRWDTIFLVCPVLLVVTLLHEFAHALTCKHHGGEVHEIGFLLLFFVPGFYCNVSDAWLFKEKSKRLWVTFAGGYFELFLWALAVFAWRLTLPGSLPHHLAFVALSVCGVQTLFNFNPLLKLDGYYLLSDWLEVPNLQQRAGDQLRGRVRWLLWGAVRPEREPRGRLLLGFGAVSWLYGLVFLALMLWGLFHSLGARWGWLGTGAVALLGFLAARGLFQGFAAGEVRTMVTTRPRRTVLWLLGLGGLAAVLGLVTIEDRAGGSFRLRPAVRAELRAPVAGFLREVYFDEGDRVSPGAVLARLEVPDLESRLTQKQAEVREVQAHLRLLEIGPRPEVVAEQRRRVERARAWRDLAQQDLLRTRQALEEDLDRLETQIAARRAELDVSQDSYQRARSLLSGRTLADEQYRETEGKYRVSRARLAEALAAKRSRQASGTLEAEAERARREQELADAEAALRVLEAGSRPEEILAEQARLARLREEVKHLEEQRQKQTVPAPVAGLVTTAHAREKVGQYVREGDLICLVEEPSGLEAEVSLAEQDVARIRPGQVVHLKARALPFETLATQVDRIAPAAGRGEVQSTVTVYCRLDSSPVELRPEMTGHARVYTGRRPIGAILLDRVLRFVRTEFWW
jgi:multidrug efflux pump subunit AcrA (membrane-fusion protein)